MNAPELTLEEVAQSFSNWRFNRRGNESIPDNLWNQVKILLTTYSRGELMRHLKLTTQQFREKGLIPTTRDNHVEVPPSFVQISLPYPSPSDEQLEPYNRLMIQRGDTQICLHHPSDAQIQLIINTLLR